MNDFFKDYKIRVLCNGFITFLARVRFYDGDDELYNRNILRNAAGIRFIEKQIALPIREIKSISETNIGIEITVMDADGDVHYNIPGATIKHASYAISQCQEFQFKQML